MNPVSHLARMFFVFTGYRGRLLVSQLLLLISALCSVGVATLTQRLINDGLIAGNLDVIIDTGGNRGLRDLRVQLPRHPGRLQERRDARGEGERVPVVVIVEGLLAEAVAGDGDAAARPLEHGEGELAHQAVESGLAPALPGVQEDLGVGARAQFARRSAAMV